jgi:DNA-binding transcriptional ArsR family regulator
MVCNSSYLADKKNLALSSDAAILAALGHRDKIRIVERLSEGQAKQKELIKDLGIASGTISRWLAELSRARIVSQDREGTHDAYWLVCGERTNELLDLVALLASELSSAHAERAAEQAKADMQRLSERRKRRS